MRITLVKNFALLLLALWPQINVSAGQGDVTNGLIVNTTSGSVIGTRAQLHTNINITSFLGIPYAEPPVGTLRFSKPLPKKPWEGVHNASSFGPMCPQTVFSTMNATGSEDCLSLNIYIPEVAVTKLGPLSVMVFIHGGAFLIGSGSDNIYFGDVLATTGEVIVVTINYRIGFLGFLCTGDDAAPGNFGLWDQKLAIQWVKDNIGNFGGDPEQITIFGESAGSMSVSIQAISPVNNRTLFQRVIAESGAADRVWVQRSDACHAISKRLGQDTGCGDAKSSHDLVDCLRNISALKIAELSLFTLYSSEGVTISPSLDGEFLPDYANNLLNSSHIGQYDLLIGVNSDEGTISPINASGITSDSLISAAIDWFGQRSYRVNPEEVVKAAIFDYSKGDLSNPIANQKTLLTMAGDQLFFAPTVNNLRHHYNASQSSEYNTTTYSYYFSMKFLREQLYIPPDSMKYIDGAPHGLDLFYVFGIVTTLQPQPNTGTELSMRMMTYWTNFAKTGDPNGDGLPFWPEWEPINETYIILDENITTSQHLASGRMNLWLDYIPSITELKDPNTCPLNVPVRSKTPQLPGTTTLQIKASNDTILGSVIGSTRKADIGMGGTEVAEFLGIPYAQPTLGASRFLPASEVNPWRDGEPRNCTIRPPACPQLLGFEPWMVNSGINETNEDCLTLNVYSPTANSGSTMAVMVYLHHGFGLYGTASAYDATTLSAKSNAVVVVPNYRLGALGFLSTGDEVAPGNAGLHDILDSLNWIKTYIGSFGGDASRVTIVGNGFGASLAHLLAASEKSKELFQRAVLMGGSAFTAPVTNTVMMSPWEKTTNLAKNLDCPTDSSQAMVLCLQEKSANELVRKTNTQGTPFLLPFAPVVDGDIFKESPLELIRAGKVNDVDYIIGFTKNEMDYDTSKFLNFSERCPNKTEVGSFITDTIPKLFHNPEMVSLAVIREYLDRENHAESPCPERDNFRLFLMDLLSAVPSIEAARYHSSIGKNSVYVYSFDQDPKYHFAPLPSWAGTSFGDDLQYLFGFPYWPESPIPLPIVPAYRLSDKKASLEWTTLISNFVNMGLPDTSSSSGVVWSPYTTRNDTYLSIDSCPDIKHYAGMVEHTYNFWTKVVPSMEAHSPVNPTWEPTDKPSDGPTKGPNQPPIGGGLGLALSPVEADKVINGLFATSICLAVLSLLLIIFVVYKATAARKSNSSGDAFAGTTGNEHENTASFQFKDM